MAQQRTHCVLDSQRARLFARVLAIAFGGEEMNLDDSQSAAKYFHAVADLAQRLATKRVAIYEHKYHYMAFGSWELVAGRRTKMLRFSYDGKESYMSYGDASVGPKDHTNLEHRSFRTWEGEDPLSFVAQVLERVFSNEC